MAAKREKRSLSESPEGMANEPPLLRFIRALKNAEGETDTKFSNQFLVALTPTNGKKTTLGYLYQLAGREIPNPTLRLAKAIVEQSRVFGPRINARPLTYEDLLIGCIATNRLGPRSADSQETAST